MDLAVLPKPKLIVLKSPNKSCQFNPQQKISHKDPKKAMNGTKKVKKKAPNGVELKTNG